MILGEIRNPQGRVWSEAGNGGMVRARDKNSTDKKLGPSAFGGRALLYRGGARGDILKKGMQEIQGNTQEAGNPTVKYKIKQTKGGVYYTEIDNPVLTQNRSRRAQTVRDIINSMDGKVITTQDGDQLTIRGEGSGWYNTAGKMTSGSNKLTREEYYDQKLPMAAQIDEIAEISEFKNWSPDKGEKHGAFASEGFDYREAIVKLGKQWYRVRLSVIKAGNENIPYNLGRITPTSPKDAKKVSLRTTGINPKLAYRKKPGRRSVTTQKRHGYRGCIQTYNLIIHRGRGKVKGKVQKI